MSQPILADRQDASAVRRAAHLAGRTAGYLALPILVIILWQGAVELRYVRPILLPPPSRVAATFWEMTVTGQLPKHLLVSLLRVLEGFAIAGIAGLVLGVGIGLSRRLDWLTDLTVQLIKPIPPIAWIPLSILWFGIGETAKLYIIFLGAFFPVLVNTVVGVRAVPKPLHDLMGSLYAAPVQTLRYLELPAALPILLGGLRIGATLSVIGAVVGELVGSDQGLGFLVNVARGQYDTALVFVAMFTLILLALVLYGIVAFIESKLLVWQESYER